MEPESTTALLQILQESGPTITALIAAVFWLNNRVQRIEDRVDTKLNNGIKEELSKMNGRVSSIEGQLMSIPKRKTDEHT